MGQNESHCEDLTRELEFIREQAKSLQQECPTNMQNRFQGKNRNVAPEDFCHALDKNQTK